VCIDDQKEQSDKSEIIIINQAEQSIEENEK